MVSSKFVEKGALNLAAEAGKSLKTLIGSDLEE